MKRATTYYLLQTLGWGLYGGFMIATSYLWLPEGEADTRYLWLNVIITLTCAGVSHGMRTFFKQRGWAAKPLGWLALRLIWVNALAAVISQAIIHAFIYGLLDFGGLQEFAWPQFFFYCINVMFVFWGWSILYFSVKAYQRNRQNEIEHWRLTAALKDAELMALKAQINPHFLFNALNNIRALVLEDGERARDMITHLSDLLRYSVKSNAEPQVPLKQELEVVQDYLRLESLHFEDRLQCQLQIGPETLERGVPPMAVQLLVENAIKHGIAELPAGGMVRIASRLEGDDLIIEVENTGSLETEAPGLGIGLANLRERAQLLFGKLATVSLTETPQQTVLAQIHLPYTP